eukprot:1060498-Rhodomonas_salina.1
MSAPARSLLVFTRRRPATPADAEPSRSPSFMLVFFFCSSPRSQPLTRKLCLPDPDADSGRAGTSQ